MYLKQYDVDPIDVDANGIAESQTPGAAGNLTLDGALCDVGTAGQFNIGDSYSSGIGGVQIGITSAADDSGRTFTVTGKDQDGQALSVAITGPNSTTVESAEYFSEITQIAVDAATAGAITVGTVDEVTTKTVPLNVYSQYQPFGVAVQGLSGTVNYTIQQTYNNVPRDYPTSWLDLQSSKTADLAAPVTAGARAVRLIVNSYSSGAELQFFVSGE